MRRLAKNIGRSSLILFASVLLHSCSRIEIKDSRWCGNLGKFGAECVWMLSDKTQTIPSADWDKEEVGMICTSARSFGDLKTAILQFCNKNPSMCSFAADDLKKTVKTLTKIEGAGKK